MSLGMSSSCPVCWGSPCNCSPEELARYHVRVGQLQLARDKNKIGVTTRTLEMSILVIDPTRHVDGTGPDDDRGVPTVTATDIGQAALQSADGYRYVYARVSVFPDNLQTSWRSAPTQDIQSATADALRHMAEKLAELPWKE